MKFVLQTYLRFSAILAFGGAMMIAIDTTAQGVSVHWFASVAYVLAVFAVLELVPSFTDEPQIWDTLKYWASLNLLIIAASILLAHFFPWPITIALGLYVVTYVICSTKLRLEKVNRTT